MTPVTDVAVKAPNGSIGNQEGTMSLLYHASEKAESNRRDYSFILALVCMALALVAASAIFAVPIGSEISNQMSLVGP